MKRIVLALFTAVAPLAFAQNTQSIAEASKAVSDKPADYAKYNLLARMR